MLRIYEAGPAGKSAGFSGLISPPDDIGRM
jgi:hypothetical protein